MEAMRSSPSFGLAAIALVAGMVGVAATECSSTPVSTGPGGAGDAIDAGVPVGGPCQSSSDCPAGAQCSNAVYAQGNPIYPTPICLSTCTPAPASEGIAECGARVVPGEGLCQPPSGSGPALCLPLCEVTPSGVIVGCQGANDVCQLLGPSGSDGAGWCLPGCTADSQCPPGLKCDPVLASCVSIPLMTTLPIGAPCSLATNPPPCNCIGVASADGGAAARGYCTAACVTGVSACPSPPADGGAISDGGDAGASAGAPWVCSAGVNQVTQIDGGGIFTTQAPGLYGFCAEPCNADADCAQIHGHCSQGDPAAPAGFTGTCSPES